MPSTSSNSLPGKQKNCTAFTVGNEEHLLHPGFLALLYRDCSVSVESIEPFISAQVSGCRISVPSVLAIFTERLSSPEEVPADVPPAVTVCVPAAADSVVCVVVGTETPKLTHQGIHGV